jgi:hypothetical protein
MNHNLNTDIDIYNYINTQFNNIRTLTTFTNISNINTSDFTTINNISIVCLDKLSDLSIHYLKKINEDTLSLISLDKLNKMYDIHNDLISKIHNFNNISKETATNIKELALLNLSSEYTKFIFEDIFNRYKLILCQISDCIKKLNIFSIIFSKYQEKY